MYHRRTQSQKIAQRRGSIQERGRVPSIAVVAEQLEERALKHEITYRRPAFLADRIVVTAIPREVRGARALYETIIKRGDEILATVRWSWCCIDAKSLRPVGLGTGVADHFLKRSQP